MDEEADNSTDAMNRIGKYGPLLLAGVVLTITPWSLLVRTAGWFLLGCLLVLVTPTYDPKRSVMTRRAHPDPANLLPASLI